MAPHRILLLLAILTAGGTGVWSSAGGAKGSATDSTPSVAARSVVFHYPADDPYDRANLYGFNHAASVTLLPNGRVLAAWFSGPHEGSVHQVILGAYSSDQGETWTAPSVLQDTPRSSDFDPSFIVVEDRAFFFFSVGRWNRYPFVGPRAVEELEVGVKSFRIFLRISDDSGTVWSEPVRVLPEETGYGCRSNGIRLSGGELLLPVHSFGAGHMAGVLKSIDNGRTWRRFGAVTTPAGAAEPSIAELRNGHVMMVVRSRDGFLWRAFSGDRGETWSAAEKTSLVAAASSHHLLRLRDGGLVLIHNPSKPPLRTPLTLRVSRDDGENWGDPLILDEVEAPGPEDPEWNRQVSYPSATELEDGTLLVVWGSIGLSANRQFGTIQAARVALKR